MSALAMFSLKSSSLLAFDMQRFEPVVKHNLRTLYGVENVPSDTYMREQLDEVDPKDLRKSYLSLFRGVQDGKLLESYNFLGGYLCLVDGTQIFNSESIHCQNCCEKHHRDGRVSYHHQILSAAIAHPDRRQVIPLCPEPITKQDGSVKNDCERNASHRFLKDLKREHPRLKLTLVSDTLSANTPYINELKEAGYSHIVAVKPEGNRTLFQRAEGICKEEEIVVGKNRYTFRYVNGVPLNDTKGSPSVNFFACEALEVVGKKVVKKSFAWITDHLITRDNLYELNRGG
ncbi:MAG: hypothetical protein K940chlam9_01340 [Chlamydiae bacterium]|nr:hypothetical protein [Chlamydiota bacterium]